MQSGQQKKLISFRKPDVPEEYRDAIDFRKMQQMVPGIGAEAGAWTIYTNLKELGESATNAYRLRRLNEAMRLGVNRLRLLHRRSRHRSFRSLYMRPEKRRPSRVYRDYGRSSEPSSKKLRPTRS
ncbi:EcsC family protein [Paenibacillus sp. V4I5]|uniref:EcsC family protein n=1 Tax=Paenibacillus sp. V4I5 TaxID=3042306 RepID=UPI003593A72B